MVQLKNGVKGRIFSLKEVREYMGELCALVSTEGPRVMAVEDRQGNCRFFLNDCFVDVHVQGYGAKEGGAL